MRLQRLILRYAGFAGIATLANLATQRAVLQAGEAGSWFAAAVGAGTIGGLVLKYLLDKRWIFFDVETGVKAHVRKVPLYTAMGLFSTAIFRGMETAFRLIWQSDWMRELGAITGLGIGYVLKYNLDRRFVFTDQRVAAPT